MTDRTCPWRDVAADARCVLAENHEGDHDVRGEETAAARAARRADRAAYLLDGPNRPDES